MRALRPFAIACAALLVALFVLSAAAPTTSRGFGLWLQAWDAVEVDGVDVGMKVDASVAWMPQICFGGPCSTGIPLDVAVDLSVPRTSQRFPDLHVDSAWVLVGPVVYPVELHPMGFPHDGGGFTSRWAGVAPTRLPVDRLRVGVVVRVRSADGRAQFLRANYVKIGGSA